VGGNVCANPKAQLAAHDPRDPVFAICETRRVVGPAFVETVGPE
jgi:hypothetical protein